MTARTIREIRVFVSSPADVAAERELIPEILERVNATDGKVHGYRLEDFRYERHVAPQIGPPAQETVDGQTPPYEIYLGIMAARFGTPTGSYGSGTEKEFRDAYSRWQATAQPHIIFYFRDDVAPGSNAEAAAQYLRVCQFREQLEPRGLTGSYTCTRGEPTGFFEQAEQHLRQVVQTLLRDASAGDTGPPPPRPDDVGRIWNVPDRRNPNFSGREAFLARVQAGLTSGRPVVLYGLAGVGKTQIAIEYAYRHAQEYGIVWWMRADSEDTLVAHAAELATRLKLPAQNLKEVSLVATTAMEALAGNQQPWLLILDGADSATARLRAFLPLSPTGHVLITSRNKNWGAVARTLKVPKFERKESVEFLLKRTGRWDEADEADLADADALAKELGDLALVLNHAGAYTEATEHSFADYNRLFRRCQSDPRQKEQLRELFRSPDPASLTSSSDLADLWTTWELNFEAVHGILPAAADLLNLCSFFASDAIPPSLLQHPHDLPAQLVQVATDQMHLDRALVVLSHYSLVDVDKASGDISIHRLVQLVTRNRMSKEQTALFSLAAVKIVNAAFPYLKYSEDFQAWKTCTKLLPHALAVTELVEHVPERRSVVKQLGQLLTKCGLYCFDRAEFDTAQRLFERVRDIDEAAYGPLSAAVARDLNHLGWVFKDRNDLDAARTCFEKAIGINETAFQPDNENITVATAVNNLGWVLKDLTDPEGARACFTRALAIDQAVFGADHPTVARDCTNLGWALEDLNRPDEARVYFERALGIDEAQTRLSANDPAPARERTTPGSALEDLNHPDEARAHSERAPRSDEAQARLSANDPKVAKDRSNLGRVCQALGDLEGAKLQFEQALKLDIAAFGAQHPTVATDTIHLGSVIKDLQRPNEARTLFEQALAIDEAAFGPRHPTVARDCIHLGSALRELGQPEQAKVQFQRALDIDKIAFHPDHPTVARDLTHLGWAQKDALEREEARKSFEGALIIHQTIFGPNDPRVAQDYRHLGWALKDLKRGKDAKTCFEHALRINEAAFGPNDPCVLTSYIDMGWLMTDLGNRGDAMKCFRRTLRGCEEAMHADSPALVNSLSDLAQKARQALAFLQRASSEERIDRRGRGSRKRVRPAPR